MPGKKERKFNPLRFPCLSTAGRQQMSSQHGVGDQTPDPYFFVARTSDSRRKIVEPVDFEGNLSRIHLDYSDRVF